MHIGGVADWQNSGPPNWTIIFKLIVVHLVKQVERHSHDLAKPVVHVLALACGGCNFLHLQNTNMT